MYRISRIDLPAAPPLSESEMAHAADLKVGSPASALALRIARPEIERLAGDRGYLAAKVTVDTVKDNSAHTVAYTFGLTLGEIYRLATLDASALPAAQQQTFLRSVHPAPGVVVDKDLKQAIFQALHDLHLTPMPRMNMVLDTVHHTATIAIKP